MWACLLALTNHDGVGIGVKVCWFYLYELKPGQKDCRSRLPMMRLREKELGRAGSQALIPRIIQGNSWKVYGAGMCKASIRVLWYLKFVEAGTEQFLLNHTRTWSLSGKGRTGLPPIAPIAPIAIVVRRTSEGSPAPSRAATTTQQREEQ